MSNQISNYPYPYSFFGLLFQSVICFLVLVFLQALIRLQNIHRTSNTTQTVSADNQLKANSNPNQQEPSSQISEDSVPVGAKGTYSQTMIEDRHALSEPRFLPPATPQAETAVAEARLLHPKLPASGSSSHKKNLQRPYEGPVFLVDVFRIGVDDPVDAVVITDETLPPRKNKKGKIAWRLPDLESAKGGRLPSFGSDERKRIFELFKERKRNRKKLLKKTSTAASDVSGMSVASASASAASASATAETGSRGWSRGRIKTADEGSNLVLADVSVGASAGDAVGGDGDRKGIDKGQDSKESLVSPSPPTGTKTKKAAKKRGVNNRENNEGVRGCPGNKENGNEEEIDASATNMLSRMSNDVAHSGDNEAVGQNAFGSTEPNLPLKSLVVAKSDRPQPNVLDPNPSISVPAAKAFIDLYYPHVTGGLSDDLAMYFSPGAQKSVSIGGAHSVVTGRDSIQLQIASFVGSQFVVKSVVAQNTMDRGAFVLITGIVQTSPSAGSQISSFAHSVNLVSAAAYAGCSSDPGASFLIFNDALMLMKAIDPVTPPPPPPFPQAPLGPLEMGAQPRMINAFDGHGSFGANETSRRQHQEQQRALPPGLLPPGF